MKKKGKPKKAAVQKQQEKVEVPKEVEVHEVVAAPKPNAYSFLVSAFFVILISVGIGCRFHGLNWDDSVGLHPDERFCTSIVPRLGFPQSMAEFFNSRISPLNPANLKDTHYVYGQLPLFIGTLVAKWTGRGQGNDFVLLGRLLSALFDCGTLLWTWLVARRLFGSRWALVAAALFAGTALHIQQSHFYVVDPFAAFFSTASFWAGVRLIERGKWSDATLCGLFFGAALACKISAALFGVAMLGFLVVFNRRFPPKQTVLCCTLCLLGTVVAFRLGHPMAFRGEFGFFDMRPELRFWDDVNNQRGITNGDVDVPFDVQWIGRAPWFFSLRNLGFWGYGWPLLLSAVGGILLLVRKPRGNSLLLIGAAFSLVLLGIQGAAFSKFTRYYLPMTPFCALLATHFWQQVSSQKPLLRWGAALTALCVSFWGVSVASIYGRPHTRLEASLWILQNIPPGTRVANETAWDESLPISWWDKGGTGDLLTSNLNSYDVDTMSKRAELEQTLDKVQWIFLSSGRSWQNIPRWPKKWPMMTEFYRSLFNGSLGFTEVKRFTSFPQFGPFQFPDAGAEEALTVYDHPFVMLFRKNPDYDAEKVHSVFDYIQFPEGQEWHPRLAPKPDESTLPYPNGY